MSKPLELSLELGFEDSPDPPPIPDVESKYPQYLEEAKQIAASLPDDFELKRCEPELDRLVFFYFHHINR